MKKLKLNHKGAFILAIFTICQSCDNKVIKKDNESLIQIKVKKSSFGVSDVFYKDTVELNVVYDGKISYSSQFDTIKNIKEDDRYTMFLVRFTNMNDILTYKELLKVKHDTFYIEKDLIKFKYIFKQRGNCVINGYVSDEVFLNNYNNTGKTRNIQHVIPFNLPVYIK